MAVKIQNSTSEVDAEMKPVVDSDSYLSSGPAFAAGLSRHASNKRDSVHTASQWPKYTCRPDECAHLITNSLILLRRTITVAKS